METTRLVEPEIGPPFAQQDDVKNETTNLGKPQVSEKATESHALANESVTAGADDHGALAKPLDEDLVEVRDLGWSNEDSQVAQPVVNGISNEQLWKLVRRFDKQTFHVKSISRTPLANLDMNIAEDEEFSPEKLRAHLERLYTSVAVQLVAFYQHVVRLRSWRERRRTILFFGVYFTAWFLDILLPTLVAFLIVLIMIPESRGVCFPFAPPALISSATGGVQKPPAGVLGSDDTITGAPESHDGEGAEQEANSFVTNIATLLFSTSIGKHPQDTSAGPSPDISIPDPTQVQQDIPGISAVDNDTTQDETKQPVSKIVWTKAEAFMHVISNVVDTWERFGNALSPTPPFPEEKPRIRLAACLAPVLVATFLTTSYVMVKSSGLIFGLLFFGNPLLSRLEAIISRTYPRWQKYLALENSILRGVPTNAQLTITLLRIGERGRAPLPPPRPADEDAAKQKQSVLEQDLGHLEASDAEVQNAIAPEPTGNAAMDDVNETPRKSSRIVRALKGTTGGAISTLLATDKVKAAIGRKHAQNRLGVVKQPAIDPIPGPVRFPARHKGNKGFAYITTTATSPALSWTPDSSGSTHAWSIAVSDVTELRKVDGLGWKSKIVVKWALEKKIVDGLVIKTTRGQEFHLTAMTGRDELFNRLLASGHQMWESY